MTGKTKPEEGYRWDYGCADHKEARAWKTGGWHHVAATWNAASGEKALYLDGRPVSRNTTEWIRSDPFRSTGFVTLGSAPASGAYDELMLWDRVLGAEEVALLAAQPAEVARALDEGLPRAQAKRSWPVEFAVYAVKGEDAASTIVEPGAEFAAKVPVHNPGEKAWQGKVTFTLLDFWEKPRDTREVALSLPAGVQQTVDVTFRAPERGIFKVAVRLPDGDTVWERDVASFAAWPAPRAAPDPESFFGHHVNSWSEGTVAQAARLGLGWNRDHNMLQFTWWPRVQPEPGEFTWTYEFHRERMVKHHMRVLGQFFGTPYWATADGKPLPKQQGPAYPYGARPNLEAFRRYVFQTVKRHPEVRHWEVWNEPDVSMFWGGSPEEFADLCRVAYEAAKAADPKVVVMNGGYTGPAWKWHEKAAQAGALKYADALSCHLYYSPDQHPEELEGRMCDVVRHFEDLARAHAGRPLPIWDTESGSSDTTWLRGIEGATLPPEALRTPLNWRQAAITAVQHAPILQSLGVVRSFQYLWQSSRTDAYEEAQAIDVTNAPKPKILARTALQAQVDGARFAGQVRRSEGRLWANVYAKRAGGSVVVWWAGRGGKVRVEGRWPGKRERVVDLMGNERPAPDAIEVDETPSYLHVAAPAEAVLRALKSVRVTVIREPVPVPQSVAADQGHGVPSLPDYVAPAENPAGVFTVDLRAFANMAFADEKAGDGVGGWADEGPLNCLHSMPTGRQRFYGVPFDVVDPAKNGGKAVLTLKGRNVTPNLPAQIAGIPLGGRPVRCLYFLHAAAWGTPGTLGKYVVHYADGGAVEVPLTIGENTQNWWNGYAEGEQSRPVPVRVTETLDGKPAWRFVRVWEWQNPRRDVPVATLEFVSAAGPQTPILLAVTGVR